MIYYLLLIIAVVLVSIGHILKVNRWGQLVSVYETPNKGALLMALAIGHTVNAVLPIRFGDAVRMYSSGKRMKNGYSLAISTVFADLYVDLITVGIMFVGLAFIGKGGVQLQNIAKVYGVIVPVVLVATFAIVVFRKKVKTIVAFFASLFNEKIEYKILYVSYMCIASVKDMITKVDRKRFVLYTMGMWISYVGAYMIFAETVQGFGFDYTTSDIFAILFSQFNLYSIENGLIFVWSLFVLMPMALCFVIACVINGKGSKEEISRPSLPQLNATDRLAFLKTYYTDENRDRIKTFLDINNDVSIIADSSASSDASTLVVMKDNRLLYRKYAFGDAGKKLALQINWIREHRDNIALPEIENIRIEDHYSSYDMPCYADAVNMFNYVHMANTDDSWAVLRSVLECIEKRLFSKNRHRADKTKEYVDIKVWKNLEIIEKAMKGLENNDSINVNGLKLPTLKTYKTLFDDLENIFKNDCYCDIHGDLTIENIVYKNGDYYLIDPNAGNIHDCEFLDYAKLLQSLHGNYEMLRTVKDIRISSDGVSFVLTKSEAYANLYQRYKEYLYEKFNEEQIKSIYCHEIIHWIRLLPYQIRKNEKMATVYYVTLLELLYELQTSII